MIGTPKPGTDAWGVLRLVVAHPGELDAEAIGQRLWRPRITSSADVLRVRACIQGSGMEWSRRASVLLGRLTAGGWIMPMQPPSPSDDVPASGYGTIAWALALTRSRVDSPELGGDVSLATSLLLALVQDRPQTVAAWAGPAPSGATRRAIAALYESRLVVPPSFRWPTQRGTALIEAAP